MKGKKKRVIISSIGIRVECSEEFGFEECSTATIYEEIKVR